MARAPWLCSLAVSLLLLPAGAALADVIHLKSGGVVSGRILSRTATEIRLQVQGGGKMIIPLVTVREVQEGAASIEEFGRRFAALDHQDTEALRELAQWAAERGLEREAANLRQMATGIRLEQLVADAQRRDHAQGWLAIFNWGRRQGLDELTLQWLLEQAAQAEPGSPGLADARARLRQDQADRRRSEQRRQQQARRGHHYPRMMDTTPSPDEIRIAREVQRQRRRGQPPRGRVEVRPAGR